MRALIERIRDNFEQRLIPTMWVVIGLAGTIFFVGVLIEVLFRIGLVSLLISGILVTYASTKIRGLGWFWGRGLASSSTAEKQNVVEDVVTFALVPRETPKGTKLTHLTDDKAIMEVKVAIRFWCWILPSTFSVLALLGVPTGAIIGFSGVWADPGRWRDSEIWQDTYMTAFAFFLIFATAMFVSFVLTRPRIRIVVKKDTIRVGSYLFDRRYSGGLRPRFSTNEMSFLPSFLQPQMGAVGVVLDYGRWGEDMKYMLNAFHSDDIIIWVNEIINGVGEQTEKKFDPYAGHKIELL